MGIISRTNPILEALSTRSSRVYKLLIQKDAGKEKTKDVVAAAEKNRIPYDYVPKKTLDGYTSQHQGAVAFVAGKKTVSLDELISSSRCPFLRSDCTLPFYFPSSNPKDIKGWRTNGYVRRNTYPCHKFL